MTTHNDAAIDVAVWQCQNCEATSAGVQVKKATRDLCSYCVASLARTGRAWCCRGKHVVAAVDMATGKTRCKPCERQRIAQYQRDPERRQAWHAAHKAERRTYNKAYGQTHSVRRSEQKYARYWANPEKYRAAERERWNRRKGAGDAT